jgi:hypothetical protein
VKNVETNNRFLLQQRVREMYRRLAGNEASLVTPLILRPIAYIVEEVGPENKTRRRAVPFQATNTVKVFEVAYLQNATIIPSLPDLNRTQWLQNNIVWKLVDGQHIIVACAQARRENQLGLLSDKDFLTRYTQRKAKFIVFNNPKLYIEASVRINAREFERTFYTMIYEDMVMLRTI